MIKQWVFYEENFNQIRISPYTDIYGENTEKVLLVRRDTKKRLLLESKNVDGLASLIRTLENGIERDKLEGSFESIKVQDCAKWIDLGIEKGVFE